MTTYATSVPVCSVGEKLTNNMYYREYCCNDAINVAG